MAEYKILVCPVCREQIQDDYEYGRYCWHAEFGGDVEAVEVSAVPLELSAAIDARQDYLAPLRRKEETRSAMLNWFGSLPQEEQDRREAERRAALSPMARAMEDMIVADIERHREWRGFLTGGKWTDASRRGETIEVSVDCGSLKPGGYMVIPTAATPEQEGE